MVLRQMVGILGVAGWLVGWPSIGRADPADPPAKWVPAEGLVGLFEYDGLAGHEAAWDATAAHAAIVDSGALAMAEDMAHQVLEALAKLDAESPLRDEGIEALTADVARDGFVLAFRRDGSFELVLPGWAAEVPRARFELIARDLIAPNDEAPPKTKEVRGRAVSTSSWKTRPLRDPNARQVAKWWAEGDDLILAVGPSGEWADAILDAIDGKAENALAHPTRRALVEDPKPETFVVNGRFFVDVRALPMIEDAMGAFPTPGSTFDDLFERTKPIRIDDFDDFPALDPSPLSPYGEATRPPGFAPDPPIEPSTAVEKRTEFPTADPSARPADPGAIGVGDEDPAKRPGLDRFQTLSGRWGFDRRTLRAEFLLEAPAPREGLAALLDLPGFRKDDLPPIPAGLSEFTVGSFHPGPVLDRIVEEDPDLKSIVEAAEAGFRDLFGVDASDDLLDLMGPSVAFYLRDYGQGADDAIDPVILIGVRDEEALVRSLGRMAAHFNRILADAEGIDPAVEGGDLASLKLEALPGTDRGYRLASPSGLVWYLAGSLRPSIVVGRGYAALAGSPESARAALELEARPGGPWDPEGPVGEALASLPDELTFLHVSDPRRSGLNVAIGALPVLFQAIANELSSELESGADDPTPGGRLLALLGVPLRGELRIRVDREEVPDPSAINAPLFPNVVAAAVDDRGLRLYVFDSIPAPPAPWRISVTLKTGGEVVLGLGTTFRFKAKRPLKEAD